jgi:hypothetical protein
MLSVILLSVILLSVVLLSVAVNLGTTVSNFLIKLCHYAECRYAECHYGKSGGANLNNVHGS